MSNIKIYVSCHDNFYVPECKYLYPVQVGTYFSDKRIPGFIHDDDFHASSNAGYDIPFYRLYVSGFGIHCGRKRAWNYCDTFGYSNEKKGFGPGKTY